MPKVITSPVKRFPGSVTLSDPLTFPQVFAYQDAIEHVHEAGENLEKVKSAWLPGIIACVDAWDLQGFPEFVTPDTFPATPNVSVSRLIAWLITEISKLFEESEPDPNA